MLAHDWLDGFGGLIRVIERDGRDVVVKNVRLDDSMEEAATDEAELAIDGSRCATCEVPGFAGVMWEGWICVLKVGDCDCCLLLA